MTWYGPFVANPERLVGRSQMTECDGVVIGTVALWGVIWEACQGGTGRNLRGPLPLSLAMASRSEEALAELRCEPF